MSERPFLFGEDWIQVKDGNAIGRSLFSRHSSRHIYKDGRQQKLFVGPGERLVLLTPDARALFVWRKSRSADRQEGVNCSIFRNEGSSFGRSSDLIDRVGQGAW
jgi:hypothetical protein